MRPPYRGLAAALLLGSGAALAADDAALAKCAAIADATERLACYDSLAGRPADAAPGGSFGLPQAAPPEEVGRVKARVVGPLKNLSRGAIVKLDNGQTWKFVGDTSAYYPELPENVEVVISKSLFGAYWLEVVPIQRKFKVKRLS